MIARCPTFLVFVLSLVLLISSFVSFSHLQQDSDTCVVPRMWVAYAPIEGLTSEHSRLAEKYALYLVKSTPYEIPLPVRPSGVPVLFVPGNAGSYRQIRSISDTSRELNEGYGSPEIDFFALDFNEAYSALHGRTLLDQAEYLNDAVKYILNMYRENGQDVSSVILLGHSMGGVVSRLAISLDNYVPGTVNTIFTLASPHLVPPAPFDGDIQKVYNRMNDFWRSNYADSDKDTLEDMTVLSVAGGKRDTMVPSDYISLDSIIPASNGLSTFSNSVNRVWTGIDHDAMMWCHQLRRQIAISLMGVIGRGTAERMEVFRKVFSGTQTVSDAVEDFEDIEASPLSYGVHQKLDSGFYYGTDLQFLTSHTVNPGSALESYELASGSPLKAYECPSKEGESFKGCRKIYPLLVPGNDDTVLSFVQTENYLLLDVSASSDWISVDRLSQTEVDAAGLSFSTQKIHATASNAVSSDFSFPQLTSGISSYKVAVSEGIKLVRQYVRHNGSRAYDSKYLVPKDGIAEVSFYGDAPFVPYPHSSPLHLQVFGEGEISIELDWKGSLGNLLMRYRILFISLPSAVFYAVLLVLFWQSSHSGNAQFYSIRKGIDKFIKSYLILSCLAASGVAYLTGYAQVRDFLALIQIPITKSFSVNTSYANNDLFVGLGGTTGAILAPLFLFVSTGIVAFFTELVLGVTYLLSFCFKSSTGTTIESGDPISDLLHKRTVFVGVISVLVLLFFPYQLAFALANVALLVMTAYFRSNQSVEQKSFNNYISTICVVMTWTCLVNAPVLAVWIQGIVVQRSMAFSSHHNLVSILPTLLFVENLSFKRIPSVSTITYLLLSYSCLHCLFYGMMQAFMIHHGFNLLAAWLLVMSYKKVFFKSKVE
ncbi:putative GPI inositol-deacylase C [Yarrowia sp. B02]|nr:putative GPI inositol-deacylase C [Yarrowia sp. B02]